MTNCHPKSEIEAEKLFWHLWSTTKKCSKNEGNMENDDKDEAAPVRSGVPVNRKKQKLRKREGKSIPCKRRRKTRQKVKTKKRCPFTLFSEKKSAKNDQILNRISRKIYFRTTNKGSRRTKAKLEQRWDSILWALFQ